MNRTLITLLTLTFLSLNSIQAQSNNDWPWWRGPDRNGIANPDQNLPIEFNATKNCRWSVPLSGRAHGSATVVGDQIFLQTANEEKKTQSVLCLDRKTGKQLWDVILHRDGMTQKSNKKGSWASSTPACDGEFVFVNFMTGDSVFTTALDLKGKQIWQTKITDYVIHQAYGSSPAIYEDLVIVSADNKGGGAICGLDRKTGKIVWKNERATEPNYPSPIILESSGKIQLFMTGVNKVSSFDPLTGKTNWEVEGATTECVTSTVTDGKRIFTSGGYPKNHVAAMATDGSGKVEWEVKTRVYVPSMLVKDGFLYAITDNGEAICWKSDTGEEMWKERLKSKFSSSPVLIGDRIYVGSEKGEMFVLQVSDKGVKILGKNTLGSEILATPTICGGEIFLRVSDYQDKDRSETFYCFGLE